MSDARAVSAVTATLRNLLTVPVQDLISGLGALTVTTGPLDMARKGETRPPQLNIFLYQTVINPAWRNMDMPRQVRPGEIAPPALALNLHYLVTAFARGDNDNDDTASGNLLMGGAMSVLHDHAILGREEIRDALGDSNLADQVERIRITPLALSIDEMTRLWGTFQSPYRISAAYECAVVLIDSQQAGRAALPVLRRGDKDQGVEAVTGSGPLLRGVTAPNRQSAGRLGEVLALDGDGLQGMDVVLRFASLMPPLPHLPPAPAPLPPPLVELPMQASPAGVTNVLLPALADDPQAYERWAPGSYVVSAIARPFGLPARHGAASAWFALAPIVTLTPNSTTVAAGDILTLTCVPRVRAGQRVLVLFGERQLEPASLVNPDPLAVDYLQTPTTITVAVPAAPAGTYLVRLRVDGIDSIPVVLSGDPALPSFDPTQQVSL
ncbi:MAG TPA: DUF4255 domain-containing protein [Telluria sp.]|jgi:hypothetical protein